MTTEFIGKGERTVVEVLRMITRIQVKEEPLVYPHTGIYTQVPIKRLMKSSFFEQLGKPQQKSSVDVVLVSKGKIICFRVQGEGHQGLGKARFDVVQKEFLEDSGCHVVDIHIWECHETFNEKTNFMSFFEITDAMRRAMVNPKWVEMNN